MTWIFFLTSFLFSATFAYLFQQTNYRWVAVVAFHYQPTVIDCNLLFSAFIFVTLTRMWLWVSLIQSPAPNSSHWGASKKKIMFLQALSSFSLTVFNKASLLIQRGEGEVKEIEKVSKKEKKGVAGWTKKACQSSFELHLIFLWELRCRKKKKKSIIEHTWILFRAASPPLQSLPVP